MFADVCRLPCRNYHPIQAYSSIALRAVVSRLVFPTVVVSNLFPLPHIQLPLHTGPRTVALRAPILLTSAAKVIIQKSVGVVAPAGGHHFTRSLDWLLFTSLDWNASCPKQQLTSLGVFADSTTAAAAGRPARKANPATLPVLISPLLSRAAELIRLFPAHEDVVMSVARKTDASLWPALFTAVGSPGALLQSLLRSLALEAAACFLIVVDSLEGPDQVG